MLKPPVFLRKYSSFRKHKAWLCRREKQEASEKTAFMYMLHPVTVDKDI